MTAARHHVREAHDAAEVAQLIDAGEPLDGLVAQGLDLTDIASHLLSVPLTGMTLIGCAITDDVLRHGVDTGALVFPTFGDRPYTSCRSTLYSAAELYDTFDPERPESYHETLDARVYRHWVATGRATEVGVVESLARRLHDHAITDALEDAIDGRRIVAIMGGHGISRTSDAYAMAARIARQLARSGFTMASGGGPGAMEATHLGAWLAGHDDEALETAIEVLAPAPLYTPSEPWLAAAMRVIDRFPIGPDAPRSIGIPTWLYGHEPPNPFATDIAKYFANSVREDGLLTIATHGIIFTPGSAGTVQEVFQDATQNHYSTVGAPSPMVFVGRDFWLRQVPVIDVLKAVGGDDDWLDLITVTDSEDEAVEAIMSYERPSDSNDSI